ncbi:hypothetical protein Sste5346_001448 [Sporothrix stenoceras]|uniref:NAD-dependent epimerase/dehydratase domain-containing protein n=1 Tax=Sporothrix stenoceras TaxID=5173 RepID=A0ABR3ZQE4_9PEZI
MSTAPGNQDHPGGSAPTALKAHPPEEPPADNAEVHPAGEPATPNPNASTFVLVTGGQGFIASRLILQLLTAGYTVRTTVNNLAQEAKVRKGLAAALTAAGAVDADADCHLRRLRFFEADLASDNGWSDAMKGCTYVHHDMTDDDAPKESVLRVLGAAHEAVIDRVVLTSSFATIGYGHPPDANRVFTENDWSIDNSSLPACHRSLLQAERAAWEYVQRLPVGSGRHGNKMQLVVLNPVGIYGPVLSGLQSSSTPSAIARLLDGTWSALPDLHLGMVDVRDLADLHVLAMTASDESSSGQRFLAASDGRPTSLSGIALAIRKERPQLAKERKVPSVSVPNWMSKAASLVSGGGSKELPPMLGPVRNTNNARARDQLGWRPRPSYETIMDTVDSLVAVEEAAAAQK